MNNVAEFTGKHTEYKLVLSEFENSDLHKAPLN